MKPMPATPAPFEMKSDHDNDNEADAVTKALASFQETVDGRLAALETKSAETKLADRLKAIETRLSRPGAGIEAKSANDNGGEIERKAFVTYLRKGAERMGDEAKALTVGNDATAGYLAPVQFGSELIKLLTQFSPIRQYAKIVQISAPEIAYPRRTLAASASWVAEIAPRPATAPAYEQIKLTPHELACYIDISNALLEDNAYDLEGHITADFAEDFGLKEGAAFVSGGGDGKPKGLLSAAGISFKTSATAAKVGLADIVTLFHALPSVHAQNGVWLMNRTTLGGLRGINDANGRPILLDPVSAGAATTLLGRPIVEAIDMPDVATGAYPILFGDLSGYRIVDRIGLSTLRDPFSLATVGQTRFHARRRVGADVTHSDRFVKLKIG